MPTESSGPSEGVKRIRNVLIPMRDGVRLAADLFVPEPDREESLPVVLEYIPYRKDEVAAEARFYEQVVRHGYAVARVDVRGTGASEGISTDEYLPQEQRDGYDTVEWLAAQPWCDGQVTMMGISYGGFTALQVAALAPPHLTSVVPMCFTDDRYTDDCHYRGGLLRKYYDLAFYGTFMIAFNALPPDPEWAGDDWARIWQQHLAGDEPYLLEWLRHQTDGPYWRQGSVREVAGRIRCPVFMIGGWRDGYPNPPLRLYEALTVPRRLLIGPWNHAFPDVAVPGPRIDYVHEVVRWLDHWCKGKVTAVMDEPPVVVYVQRYDEPDVDRLESAGEWRAETEWPPPGAGGRILYLGAGGSLEEKMGADGDEAFEYEPTVGVSGGLWSGGLPFGLPGDQRPDEALSLVHTSPPLEEEVHVLGRPRAVLHVASSASVIGFAASLADVAPSGSSHLVCKGMLNATRRRSLREPEPLVPGEIYELEVELDATGWLFEKGHRIRLAIASADWPNVWPTPEPATNRVYRGVARPSRLILPVVPPRGSGEPPSFRPSPLTVSRHVDRPEPPVWEVVRDVLSGRTTVRIRDRREQRIDAARVAHREYSLTAQLDPADPAGASARGRHVSRIVRPDGVAEASSDVSVQATAEHFHVTIELAVHLNGTLRFARRWAESVPRQLL
ncbi:MAG TPA: CocE/NonD family hydrolase [Gaiellaceae bacterium]